MSAHISRWVSPINKLAGLTSIGLELSSTSSDSQKSDSLFCERDHHNQYWLAVQFFSIFPSSTTLGFSLEDWAFFFAVIRVIWVLMPILWNIVFYRNISARRGQCSSLPFASTYIIYSGATGWYFRKRFYLETRMGGFNRWSSAFSENVFPGSCARHIGGLRSTGDKLW